MIQYKLTENEAKMLRGINDYGKAGLFELASMARLTPDEARKAATGLAERRLVDFNQDRDLLVITKEGEAVRQTLVKSTYKPTSQFSAAPVEIVSSEEAVAESPIDSMDADQLEAAFNEELEKYSGEAESSGG